MQPVIRVENLGKRFQIPQGGYNGDYQTIRESLVRLATAPLRRFGRSAAARLPREKAFWALQDVNFTVEPGEVVGIIGRNGAGKSTLLKILSRIIRPTTGRVEFRGRVGSLLEVGTGFHPELTGRENIYLNGSILGMTRREVDRKFDRIVEFAGTGEFLDTPAKRYSSGMYVRLAFSVAAHFEPEILIIDEVLAVGDSNFQRRCIERMGELARGGSTLLFVSHNLDLIPRLCDRALLLEQGRVAVEGSATDVTNAYLAGMLDGEQGDDLRRKSRRGDGRARFERLTLLDGQGRPAVALRSGEDLTCVVVVESTEVVRNVALLIGFQTIQGTRILSAWNQEVDHPIHLTPGRHEFTCRFHDVRLRPGRQVIAELAMSDARGEIDVVDAARVLDVVEAESSGYSARPDQGHYLCEHSWTTTATSVGGATTDARRVTIS